MKMNNKRFNGDVNTVTQTIINIDLSGETVDPMTDSVIIEILPPNGRPIRRNLPVSLFIGTNGSTETDWKF